MYKKFLFGLAVASLMLFAAPWASQAAADVPEATLWRIGLKDNASAEFTGRAFPENYEIPKDWETRSTWPEFPPSSSADPKSPAGKLDTTIHFTLVQVPANGALFRVKTVNASSQVTELAVFANALPCGILQTVGTESWGSSGLEFGNTYQLYIPREFLKVGDNTLRLRKLGHPYNRDHFEYLSITFDWLELVAPAGPAAEPLHSRYVRIGAAWGQFEVNAQTVACEPRTWEWLGIAYSGNPMRATFWANNWHIIKTPREYLEAARDYNMAVVVDYSHCMPKRRSGMAEWADANGELDPFWKKKIDDFISKYGSLIQYYEVCNEPCMGITDASFAANLAVAKYVHSIKPASMKVSAPAFTYGGGAGDPKDWDLSAENRRQIEAFCDTTNGHAYGNSYAQNRGNLIETIRTFSDNGIIQNGFPKEFINTEMGVVLQWHKDQDNIGCSAQINASMLDRIHRAHAGFCDLFTHFTTFGPDDVRLLAGKPYEPETWASQPFPKAGPQKDQTQESPVTVLRRMTLAYATHGRPLPYEYANRDEVENRLVYFRAVDTSALAPLPGSGGMSNKVLLSFVNFSRENQTVRVKVTFPTAGVYRGTRFGPEDQYMASRGNMAFDASPAATLVESLGPGEAVEYILERDASLAAAPHAPPPPTGLTAEGGRIGKLGYARLKWKSDAAGDSVFRIQRSEDGVHFIQVDTTAHATEFDDASAEGPLPGKTYVYRVKAANAAGDSAPSEAVKVAIPEAGSAAPRTDVP